MNRITSRQNPKIKDLLKLQKSSERKKQGLFLIEGIREISRALASSYEITELLFCQELIEKGHPIFEESEPIINRTEVSREVFNKIVYREDSGGILAIARMKPHSFDKLKLSKNPLILVIEGVEKPGNIGAIYRTADAAGIDGIILCDPLADIYNPNAIRASLGTVFSVPTVVSTTQEAINFLNINNIQIYTTYLEASISYNNAEFQKPTAIVAGTEATGITKEWISASKANLIIPMRGIADSLNVSVSTAIVLFEACRQRDFQ
ncbi:MAG: RNA methyltransferase [Bacteroidales bacterium]|nr:RNA methyltransferase [Bacteroidales bacterium]